MQKTNNNILVTGGAGYIGSHIVEQLIKNKEKVIILDNLVTGYKKLINKKAKFIKISKLNSSLGTGNVLNTNYCNISVCETRIKNKYVIFSALDNLVKGASGQAIQNMNILYNFPETFGLK